MLEQLVSLAQAALDRAHIFVTATGNKDILTVRLIALCALSCSHTLPTQVKHLKNMRDGSVVCNIGHFDNEIQVFVLLCGAFCADSSLCRWMLWTTTPLSRRRTSSPKWTSARCFFLFFSLSEAFPVGTSWLM